MFKSDGAKDVIWSMAVGRQVSATGSSSTRRDCNALSLYRTQGIVRIVWQRLAVLLQLLVVHQTGK